MNNTRSLNLEALHKKRKLLRKNASRKTGKQKVNEELFVDDLDNLFDIAHADAL